ncbi:unnamed protein product, partial [Mesorhabditis spiculigera]
MIEFIAVIDKGGMLYWHHAESDKLYEESINKLIMDVLAQERANINHFKHNDMVLKFRMDNEYDLLFIVIHHSIIQLAYADKLLADINASFCRNYEEFLSHKENIFLSGPEAFEDFTKQFQKLYKSNREESEKEAQVVRKPMSYQESYKSKKTVESMIISRPGEEKKKPEPPKPAAKQTPTSSPESPKPAPKRSDDEDEDLQLKRQAFLMKQMKQPKKKEPTSPPQQKKKGKDQRVWELGGSGKEAAVLDYSAPAPEGKAQENPEELRFLDEQRQYVGHSAEIKDLDYSDDEEEDDDVIEEKVTSKGGWLSQLKGLVGNKKLTATDIAPVMDKMRENLIMKNVAAEPAEKICDSVANKLEGKVLGTFARINNEVKEAMRESLTHLLTPKRRIDILRDILQSKSEKRPYVVVFCGVNGVGKSTNLAKITFWLNENGHKVLIAAGDTFRAGAVEQLRTHTKHLNALHPNSVKLYEQGYGKDPAGLAAAAVEIAKEAAMDVVLVDTAGRMQDNDGLMRALAKLIHVNKPDLTLFVGEALVGNEAVDQLVKFNQALANHTPPGEQPRLIDGMVLTKFDTIDDKVGAAVSMTYITGQPIIFVGCGQTYRDLRSLNVSSVVAALLK